MSPLHGEALPKNSPAGMGQSWKVKGLEEWQRWTNQSFGELEKSPELPGPLVISHVK